MVKPEVRGRGIHSFPLPTVDQYQEITSFVKKFVLLHPVRPAFQSHSSPGYTTTMV